MRNYRDTVERRMKLVGELEKMREEGAPSLQKKGWPTQGAGERYDLERYDLDQLAEHIQLYEERCLREKCPVCSNRHLPVAKVQLEHFTDPRSNEEHYYLAVLCSCGYGWSEPVEGDEQ
jgi:hypothetical protein